MTVTRSWIVSTPAPYRGAGALHDPPQRSAVLLVLRGVIAHREHGTELDSGHLGQAQSALAASATAAVSARAWAVSRLVLQP